MQLVELLGVDELARLASFFGIDQSQLAALGEGEDERGARSAGLLGLVPGQPACAPRGDTTSRWVPFDAEQQQHAPSGDAGQLGALERGDQRLLGRLLRRCPATGTSTALILRSPISRSRSRRNSSSSGSSGMVPPSGRARRLWCGPLVVRRRGDRRLRSCAPSSRRRLGVGAGDHAVCAAACSASFLVRPSPSPHDGADELDPAGEALLVLGPVLAQHVARQLHRSGAPRTPAAATCGRWPARRGAPRRCGRPAGRSTTVVRRTDARRPGRRRRARPPCRRRGSRSCPDRRWPPRPCRATAPPPSSTARATSAERRGADQLRTMAGEHPLAHVRRDPEQVVGHDEAQDGVTEELEPFVGRDAHRSPSTTSGAAAPGPAATRR